MQVEMLYDTGTENVPWEQGYTTGGTFTKNTDHIYLSSASSASEVSAVTTNPVDLTDWDFIAMVVGSHVSMKSPRAFSVTANATKSHAWNAANGGRIMEAAEEPFSVSGGSTKWAYSPGIIGVDVTNLGAGHHVCAHSVMRSASGVRTDLRLYAVLLVKVGA